MTAAEVQSGTGAPPRRRRGRPRALTLEQVVDAALRLVDEHGEEQLTMGRLASELGVAVVTVYAYVADREALLDLIVERAVSDIAVPERIPADPRRTIRGQWVAYREFLRSHPGTCELIVRSVRSSEHLFDHLEASLALLGEAGLGTPRAVRAHTALLTYTTGFVTWELARTHWQRPGDYAATVVRLVGALDAAHYPHMRAAVDALTEAPTDEGFLAGLDALLDGLLITEWSRT